MDDTDRKFLVEQSGIEEEGEGFDFVVKSLDLEMLLATGEKRKLEGLDHAIKVSMEKMEQEKKQYILKCKSILEVDPHGVTFDTDFVSNMLNSLSNGKGLTILQARKIDEYFAQAL